MTEQIQHLESIRIVLVEPQVPGNIGAVSRAIKNMGLNKLVLVRPWFHNHPQARYMAHGSEDILDSAEVYDEIGDAVADSILVVGTTQRKRHNMQLISPRQAVSLILDSTSIGPVSILFGREDKGLSNEELTCCQIHVTIPSSPSHPSLNLSQAVMVMAYELFSASLRLVALYDDKSQNGEQCIECLPRSANTASNAAKEFINDASSMDFATSGELTTMYDHLRSSITRLGFKQWNKGDNYMKSLRRVFSRTRMERRDVSTVHKLCGEIDKYSVRVRAELENDNNGNGE